MIRRRKIRSITKTEAGRQVVAVASFVAAVINVIVMGGTPTPRSCFRIESGEISVFST